MVHTRVHSNDLVKAEVKVTILLECSDLFQTDFSASFKGLIIRRL